MIVRVGAVEVGDEMVVQVRAVGGCECGVISVVPSLLRCARVRVLRAECRWYMPGAAICTRRKNAAVRKVSRSGRIGGGWMNQDGMGMHAGGGVLVPSVARSAVRSEAKRLDAV
eukprot:1258341-Rhodomonas_salina.2